MSMKFLFQGQIIRTSIIFTLVIVIWVIFAPSRFGGQTDYVIVNGNSMLPLFNKGDLVLLQKAPFYQEGDIVAYQYPKLGPVIHRIIGRNVDRFIMRGDNNKWVDGYEPAPDDILGKYWVLIYGMGTLFEWLRTPWMMALLSLFGVIFLGLAFMEQPDTTRNWKLKDRAGPVFDKVGPFLANQTDWYMMAVYFVGLVCMILGVFAFTRPIEQKITDNIIYNQSGSYTYSAGSIVPGVYDNDRLGSGDVIFPQLTCHVNLAYKYSFQSDARLIGVGKYQLAAEVGTPNGWHRRVYLQPPATFNGTKFDTQAILDVCQLQGIIKQMQAAAHVDGGQYTLVVVPNVFLTGQLGGRAFEATFSPTLTFFVEPSQVYLSKSSQEGEDPLLPSTKGLLAGFKMDQNTLNILGIALPVDTARKISIFGLLAAIAGWVIAGTVIKRAQKSDERLLAKLTLGSRMVEARGSLVGGNDKVVELTSLDDLVRLAERMGALVFFQETGNSHVDYLVRDENVTYLFQKVTQHPAEKTITGDISHELEQALIKSEFVLYYQPVVSLQTGETTQVEALLRWQHPKRGLLLPMDFLPQAEQAGLISQIDQWVLRNACMQLKRWIERGYPQYPLAINISGCQLKQTGFEQIVAGGLKEFNLPANLLHIEIPLDSHVTNPNVLSNIKSLNDMGVGISINDPLGNNLDEAGTNLNVNQIKISRSLVQKYTQQNAIDDTAKRWITIARKKKIRIVAVGIETQEQLGFFQENEFDGAQGYLISQPLPFDEITRYLAHEDILIKGVAKEI